MSLWGLVSSLSDSGAAFLASTARDIAEFKHALKDETKDIHIAARGGDESTATPTSQQTEAQRANSGNDDADADADTRAAAGSTGGDGSSGAQRDSSATPSSSLSSLTSNIERLGGRVLHMLPGVFRHSDNDNSGRAAVSEARQTRSALPPSARHGSSGSSGGGGGFDQRLLSVMRDRDTYAADPIDARTGQPSAAYASFAESFRADCSQRSQAELDGEWAALLASHPSIRHWYEQLVETGQADAHTFWCRYQYIRQSLQEDERRRQKLADRLAGISAAAAGTTATQQRQRVQQTRKDDEMLQWDEDEDDEARDQQQPQQQQLPHQQRDPSPDDTHPADKAAGPSVASSPSIDHHHSTPQSSDVGALSEQEQQDVNDDTSTSLEGEASSAVESVSFDADEGDGELLRLSPSPVSSEGSGELIDHHEAATADIAPLDTQQQQQQHHMSAAAATNHTHSVAVEQLSETTRTAAPRADKDDSRDDESYDDWA